MLICTILQRFAADPEQAIARMGPRVAKATHLGEVLLDEPRDDIPEPEREPRSTPGAPRRGRAGVGQETSGLVRTGRSRPAFRHTRVQEQFVRFALAMRAIGLPPGQP
jgi:hypothetical protein